MPNPNYLILATARKRYPFLLLSISGIVAYFETRAAAETFIKELEQ